MIQKFIAEICDILNIPTPKISYNTTHFTTNTMMAQCDSTGKTIYLKKYDKSNPDQFFAIAHELRHIWQIQNNKHLFFRTYKTIDKCSGVEEYNLQLAEIDANAFASLAMIDFFNFKPTFEGAPASVKIAINNRINFLLATEFFQ